MTLVSLTQTATSVSVAVGIVMLAAAVASYLRWWRPRWRAVKGQVIAGRDVLVGRPAIIDPVSKREIAPPLASLGQRLDLNQTEINGSLRDIVALLESQQAQDRRLEDHESRITSLEVGAVERIVTKAESAAAWRAVEAVSQPAPGESDE